MKTNFNQTTRLPASRSSSIGPKGRFLFLHPKVNGGVWGVHLQKQKTWSKNAF